MASAPSTKHGAAFRRCRTWLHGTSREGQTPLSKATQALRQWQRSQMQPKTEMRRIYDIYIWYDIWYMINYVMIYDDLCLKLIKYDVIITYNQNLVRWDRWVMIVPRQIWWTLAVCSQAEHGTSTSTLQYPAPICHVHLIELQVTEDSFVPRTTFALGHLSNASQSMKFIEISWPVSHYRDLCGGIHMRLYTVVIL
jgi:hypothetical protein